MELTEFIIFFLTFVRIISFLGTSPIFMFKGVPNLVKVGLALTISILIYNFVGYNESLVPSSLLGLMAAAIGETVFGLALGYITTLVINGVRMAGQLMDMQIGLSMASQFDPVSSTNVTLLGNITQLTGLMIFFIINGHHMLIESLIESFQIVPIFGAGMPPEASSYVLTLFIKIIFLSLKLAAPVIIVILLTDFTMGIISRTVPQLNILMLGLPVKVLVGLLVFSAALPGIVHAYIRAFQDMPKDINNFFTLFPLAIFFASGEKTEDPTSKKKNDAKKKGQAAKSREFISAITLIGVLFLLISLSGYGLEKMEGFLTRSLNNIGQPNMTEGDVGNALIFSIIEFFKITFPVFGGVIVLGVAANLAQTGFIRSTEPLKPKLSKLNPIEGFKKMFSMRAFMELLKSSANIAIIGYVTISYVKGEIPKIISIPDMGLRAFIDIPKSIIQSELARAAVVVFILGIIDLLYQRYAFKKDLRMTKQEVKEEFKQMEGDPQIKSKIRQKQREMAQRRMMHQVPDATVVVTNPTHIAVALKYEEGQDSPPVLVAKGADLVANNIKKVAKENNVPIVENKPVARMLYQRVEIDESIPIEMYQAVAEILAVVYRLKNS